MAVERLWSDQELISLKQTIENLRRIRTASATEVTAQRNSVFRFILTFANTQIDLDRDQILFDARNLADTAANFFAARISGTSNGEIEFEQWQDSLSDSDKKYRRQRPSTYARTTSIDVGGDLIGRMRALTVDPSYMVYWDLIKANNLGAKSIDELLEKKVGVVAPLSGDYLSASVDREYLRRTREKTFPLKLASASRDLKIVHIEADAQGEIPFSELNEIGIFLDIVETGNTGSAVYEATKTAYPQARVHLPIAQRVEFRPSSKLKRFNDRLEQNRS